MSGREEGPGKYDPECAMILHLTQARGAVVIVIDGNRGHGVACKVVDPALEHMLPSILEKLAKEIRASLPAVKKE